MTAIKRKSNGTIEIIDTDIIEVEPDDNVFSEATQSAAVDVIPAWQPSQGYVVDDVVSYDGKLWRVTQAHTSQVDWLPSTAWSLFTETWPSGTTPTWQQPQGAHDSYPQGFEVYHTPTDRIWVSDIDANVWEPNSGANTWTLRDDQAPLQPQTDEWQAGVAYSIGDIVTYQGTEYECIQAHTSISVWQPPNVPALWQPV